MLIVVFIDTLASIIAGIIVFSYLGFLAHKLGVLPEKLIDANALEGPKIAFIGIPYAISKIDYFYGCPQLLAALSFFMFLVVGFSSLYMNIEVILNTLDQINARDGSSNFLEF